MKNRNFILIMIAGIAQVAGAYADDTAGGLSLGGDTSQANDRSAYTGDTNPWTSGNSGGGIGYPVNPDYPGRQGGNLQEALGLSRDLLTDIQRNDTYGAQQVADELRDILSQDSYDNLIQSAQRNLDVITSALTAPYMSQQQLIQIASEQVRELQGNIQRSQAYRNDQGGGGGGYDPRPITRRVVLECGSQDYRYNTCEVGGLIVSLRINRQLSGSSCLENESYGAQGSRIWVDRGCRAEFEVQLGSDQFNIGLVGDGRNDGSGVIGSIR